MTIRTLLSQTCRISSTTLSQRCGTLKPIRACWEVFNRQYSNLPGSGAGKGGGGGGSVKDAGGGLGRYGAAQEEGYFYNQDKEKLSKLKKQLKENLGLQQKPEKKDK